MKRYEFSSTHFLYYQIKEMYHSTQILIQVVMRSIICTGLLIWGLTTCFGQYQPMVIEGNNHLSVIIAFCGDTLPTLKYIVLNFNKLQPRSPFVTTPVHLL